MGFFLIYHVNREKSKIKGDILEAEER